MHDVYGDIALFGMFWYIDVHMAIQFWLACDPPLSMAICLRLYRRYLIYEVALPLQAITTPILFSQIVPR